MHTSTKCFRFAPYASTQLVQPTQQPSVGDDKTLSKHTFNIFKDKTTYDNPPTMIHRTNRSDRSSLGARPCRRFCKAQITKSTPICCEILARKHCARTTRCQSKTAHASKQIYAQIATIKCQLVRMHVTVTFISV